MNIKREPGTNRHHNMSGKKQSLKEYQKKIIVKLIKVKQYINKKAITNGRVLCKRVNLNILGCVSDSLPNLGFLKFF